LLRTDPDIAAESSSEGDIQIAHRCTARKPPDTSVRFVPALAVTWTVSTSPGGSRRAKRRSCRRRCAVRRQYGPHAAGQIDAVVGESERYARDRSRDRCVDVAGQLIRPAGLHEHLSSQRRCRERHKDSVSIDVHRLRFAHEVVSVCAVEPATHDSSHDGR